MLAALAETMSRDPHKACMSAQHALLDRLDKAHDELKLLRRLATKLDKSMYELYDGDNDAWEPIDDLLTEWRGKFPI